MLTSQIILSELSNSRLIIEYALMMVLQAENKGISECPTLSSHLSPCLNELMCTPMLLLD